MKNYDFIPHAANIRNSSQVLNLIESEGAAGYGFYWSLLEYLRAQPYFTGDIRAIKNIARQMKVRMDKALRILNNYNLFVVENDNFHSPLLNDKMTQMKRKCDKTCSVNDESLSEVPCNSLETRDASFKNKNKKIEEDTSSPISSSSPSEEAAEAAAEAEVVSVSSVPRWERLVDELQTDQQWLELVAMRSGLNRQFHSLFPRIVECFKRHVRCMGNEGRILSTSDAKHYFFFFLNPSSPTYKNLILELQKPVDKGKYRFEDGHPSTGKRSYCGIPIPDDAPPRPNDQAVWNLDLRKWVF